MMQRIHPSMALPTNKTMYLHRLGDLVRIQLFQNAKPDPDMLTIELTSGACSLSTSSKALNEERGAEKILGVFGLQKLVNGYALALITGVKQVLPSCTHHPSSYWEEGLVINRIAPFLQLPFSFVCIAFCTISLIFIKIVS